MDELDFLTGIRNNSQRRFISPEKLLASTDRQIHFIFRPEGNFFFFFKHYQFDGGDREPKYYFYRSLSVDDGRI